MIATRVDHRVRKNGENLNNRYGNFSRNGQRIHTRPGPAE